MSRSFTFGLVAFLVLPACSGADSSGNLFGPTAGRSGAGGGAAAAGASNEGGSAGSAQAGGAGGEPASVGGAGGGEEGGSGGTAGIGGGPSAGAGGGDVGGSAGAAQGGQSGSAGAVGATICQYKAYDEWTLGALEQKVNADLAAGWAVHSFHARSENNSGAALPNVVWLSNGKVVKGFQALDIAALAKTVSSQLALGATLHSVHARPHGSSVAPEVAWLVNGSALSAHDDWSLGALQQAVAADVGAGFSLLSFHAREENNSGASKPNVVWLKGASGYQPLSDFSLTNLAAAVTSAVAKGATVEAVLARPHSSSVPTEVAWLEKGGVYRAYESSTLSTIEQKVNVDVADGWSIVGLFAREQNNSGSAKANVVWMQKGAVMKALQDSSVDALASAVNAQLAAGFVVHTIRARAISSSVAPEVSWLQRSCP